MNSCIGFKGYTACGKFIVFIQILDVIAFIITNGEKATQLSTAKYAGLNLQTVKKYYAEYIPRLK